MDLDQRIKNAVLVLMEFCDSVQIVATEHSEKGTRICQYGRGNFYARLGSCQTFLDSERDLTQINIVDAKKDDDYREGENF